MTDDDAPDDTPVRSRLDELRDELAAPRAKPRLFKALPVNHRLVAEYRVLSEKEAQDAMEGKREHVATLSTALVQIHAHDPDHEAANDRGLVPLHVWADCPELGELRFDKRLTDVLGWTHDTDNPLPVDEIVLRLFEGNEIALAAQSSELAAWMTKTDREVFQDFAIGS